MDFDAENNSIFEELNSNAGMSMPQNMPMQELPPQQNLLGNFINSVKNKLEETKQKKDTAELEKQLHELVEKHEDTFLIFKSFGCKLTMQAEDIVELSSDEFNMKGLMHIKDGDVEMDENCEKIFTLISTIVNGGYQIGDVLSKYEEQEFYPVGEIEQIPITFQGREITASRGHLANAQGEIKTIIFYKGYEIKPDDDSEKEN